MSSDLIPLLPTPVSAHGKPAVSARVLYAFLELNPTVWARWAKKNILANPYAIEHDDWEGFLPDVENPTNPSAGGRPTQDYALSIDFAKKLAMMARSSKGEAAREYFLTCEQQVLDAQQRQRLPQMKNPANQLMIDAVIRIDALEQAQEEHRLALVAHQAQVIATQQQAIDALTQAAQADSKATQALETQQFLTIAEYVYVNGLERQMPVSLHREYGTYLSDYCQRHGIPTRKIPVAYKSWEQEYGYHTGLIAQTLPAWLKRRFAQADLTLIHGGPA